MARNGREFFVTGHSEYSPLTLDTEYRRDLAKGLPIEMPPQLLCGRQPGQRRIGTVAGACQKKPAVLQLAELLCISGNPVQY